MKRQRIHLQKGLKTKQIRIIILKKIDRKKTIAEKDKKNNKKLKNK